MIVYEATKHDFMDHVVKDEIALKIYESYKNKIGRISESEINSWNNSMNYMYKVLNTPTIPEEAGIAIEYKIPSTSRRIDFMLSGLDDEDKNSVIIIELKQWDKVDGISDRDGIIKTPYLGRAYTTHPSYQAWTYAKLISEYNESVQNDGVSLYPCAYLHNYFIRDDDPLTNEIYNEHLSRAPVFTKGDVFKLREFITRYIRKPDFSKTLYIIENGKIRPSKSLQDSLLKMLKGNEEFVMIDDQKLVFEAALEMARESFRYGKKQVLIVEGGPGTGKSVLEVNLLVKLTSEDMVCQYVTKNSAPREVYSQKLQKSYTKGYIDNLFKGSGVFYQSEKNEFDVLIVDEAHRLGEKSGLFKNKGENQTKEIINASKISIFFIDEHQKITTSDFGSKVDIIKFAELKHAKVTQVKLESQFRCNGSDGYLSWLDDVLEIGNTANFDGFEFEYDFRIIDNPNHLRDLILEKNNINNKARLLAGYCWNWITEGKTDKNTFDISIKEHDFNMSWNLSNSTWAIDSDSIDQVGCIHTSQGLEFDYVGVIIGNDMRYAQEKIITDFTKRAKTDKSLNGIKKIYKNNNDEAMKIADQIIKNTYRTLMTRGQKGCYVYCVDQNLGEYLKERLKMFYKPFEYTYTTQTTSDRKIAAECDPEFE
jgi:uncharacterized protein